MSTNYGVSLEQRLNPSVTRSQQLSDIIMQSLRVALPGIVQSFDPGPPATVTVLIATNEYEFKTTSDTQINLQTVATPLGVLTDVPILIPTAGGYSLTFPIQQGDECLVVFMDTPRDFWLQNGGTNNNPISQRRHSLSDGVAIFGLRSKPNAISDYSTDSVQLRNEAGDVMVELTGNVVNVTAPTVNVNGSSQVNITGGNVDIGSSTTIDARLFLAHIHNGVQSGSNTSGGVV